MPIRLYKRHDMSLEKLSPSDMTLNSASSIYIGSQHISEKEESNQGGIYNRLTTGFLFREVAQWKYTPPEKTLVLQGM